MWYEATIEDPEDVHAAVEDQHAALSPRQCRRAAQAVQVRRVRRGADVRAAPQERRRSRRGTRIEIAHEATMPERLAGLAVALVAAIALRTPAPVAGQAPAGVAKPVDDAAHGRTGNPDLQGNWTQRDDHADRAAAGRAGLVLTEEAGGAHGKGLRRPRRAAGAAERPEPHRRRRRAATARPARRATSAATTTSGSIPAIASPSWTASAASSIIIDPPNGAAPALTPRRGQRAARRSVRERLRTRGGAVRSPRAPAARPNAACCRSARTPGRRCCPTTSTTTTTRSCRRRIT